MLWLLQPSTPGRTQQKVFPEDHATGLQSQTVPIREAKPQDDLVHNVLSGTPARPSYLSIPPMFESRHGNFRQEHHAKEV